MARAKDLIHGCATQALSAGVLDGIFLSSKSLSHELGELQPTLQALKKEIETLICAPDTKYVLSLCRDVYWGFAEACISSA